MLEGAEELFVVRGEGLEGREDGVPFLLEVEELGFGKGGFLGLGA